MIDPITTDSFMSVCNRWTAIINAQECGIEFWYPIAGAHMRIKQFLADKTLQQTLLRQKNQELILIDAQEKIDFLPEEIYKQVNQKKPTAIFLIGLDTYLSSGNETFLTAIHDFVNENTSLSLLLFSELNIAEHTPLKNLLPKSIFYQNVSYQPLYTHEDSIQFLHYLQDKWQFTIKDPLIEELSQEFGGHFLLLKEAARIVRDHPDYTLQQILATSSLKQKGIAIFQAFSLNDQQTIQKFLNGKTALPSDFLLQTHIIRENKLTIKYWDFIKDSIITNSSNIPFEISLTASEREVYETLQDTKGIITREFIAQNLWQDDWEEKYSDWAIDQLMHKLREKIKKAQLPFEILTKKGEGFILVDKAN